MYHRRRMVFQTSWKLYRKDPRRRSDRRSADGRTGDALSGHDSGDRPAAGIEENMRRGTLDAGTGGARPPRMGTAFDSDRFMEAGSSSGIPGAAAGRRRGGPDFFYF